MQPLNGTAGAFQRAVAGRRKSDNRAMEALLNPRGENDDYPLMPLRMVHRQPAGQGIGAALQLLTER